MELAFAIVSFAAFIGGIAYIWRSAVADMERSRDSLADQAERLAQDENDRVEIGRRE